MAFLLCRCCPQELPIEAVPSVYPMGWRICQGYGRPILIFPNFFTWLCDLSSSFEVGQMTALFRHYKAGCKIIPRGECPNTTSYG